MEKEKPGDREKPDDQEKLDDQAKPGDQKKLGDQEKKLGDKIKFSNFFPWSEKNEGENQDKRERVIRERLVRFAQAPRSTIFEFVTPGFILFVCRLTNSKSMIALNLEPARADYQLKELALPWRDMVPISSLVSVALRRLVSYFQLLQIRSISSF